MKLKAFFINFQGLSVAKNCARPDTAPLVTSAIKRELSCKFTKSLKGHHFMGHSGTDLKFSITIDLQIFENFLVQSFFYSRNLHTQKKKKLKTST